MMDSPIVSARHDKEANLYSHGCGPKSSTRDELQLFDAAPTETDLHPLANVSRLPAGQNAQEKSKNPPREWKAGRGEWMIIIVLAIVSLMVALDATILVSALSVSIIHS